jgi:hypothetical protein
LSAAAKLVLDATAAAAPKSTPIFQVKWRAKDLLLHVFY